MSELNADDFVNGSSFFGFMGVTMALVLASILFFMQILELLMEQPKLEQASAVLLSGDQVLL